LPDYMMEREPRIEDMVDEKGVRLAREAAEPPPTMPQEAQAAEAPASAIPPVERRVGPQWNDIGEDVRYQNDRRAPGNFLQERPPAEPELKIEPPTFEKGVPEHVAQEISAAHDAGVLTAQDFRDAGAEIESPPVAETNAVPRSEAPAENGGPGRPGEPPQAGALRESGPLVGADGEVARSPWDNGAVAKEDTVPTAGVSETNDAAAGGEAAAVEPASVGAASISADMDRPTAMGMVNHLTEQMRRETGDLGNRIGDAVGGRGLRFAEQADPEAAKKLA